MLYILFCIFMALIILGMLPREVVEFLVTAGILLGLAAVSVVGYLIAAGS